MHSNLTYWEINELSPSTGSSESDRDQFRSTDRLVRKLDCEQSLKMVTRARKSSEASESRGEAGEEAVSLSANSLSPVLPSLDSTD